MNTGKGKALPHPFQHVTPLIRAALIGVVVCSLVLTFNHFKISRYFPVKTVRVYGITHVSQAEVQELLLPLVNRGFFTVNVEFIRDRLLQMPWVSSLSVRRVWPDQVEVTVVEKKAAAHWNQTNLLSTAGELFTPEEGTSPANLPQLAGPDGQQIVMLKYLNQINQLLAPVHVKIAYLELTPFMTWKMRLDNGVMLQAGHKDILTRLGHFVKVYPKIVGERAADVEYVDLRYSNGMAIRWKTVVKT